MGKSTNHAATMEEVNWKEARTAFAKVKPELAEIIDERKANKQFTLIRVRYPYGATVLQDGILHLPNSDGEVVPINHPTIDKSIRDKLSYSNFPLGLITKNGMEVSREVDKRVITLRFFLPGTIMGLWESLAPPKSHFPARIWTVTAGARFIFTLPKIQAAKHYKRLKKAFDLPPDAPQELSQQWHAFKQIANHPNFDSRWHQEIYFFTKDWMVEDKKNMDWIKFHHFLLEQAWDLSEYARNVKNADVIWDLFASILSSKGRKPNPLHMDILKHIVGMALGDIPGMRAAGKSELAAPVSGLQNALIEHYNLKQYVPTIMHPHHFSMDGKDDSPVYYSYHASNLLNSLPSFKNSASTLTELLLLHDLVNEFLDVAISGQLKMENTFILDMLEKVKFTYFHSDVPGSYKSKILNTREMPEGDPNLIYLDKQYDGRQFSESSHFVRGCVRISRR